MNYIAQIKGFWLLHSKHDLNVTDTSLYFYLLEVCNSANWVNPFKRNNAKIITDLRITRTTFFRSRRKLSLCGILYYKSASGMANVTYQLTDLEMVYRNRNEAVICTNGPGDGTGCGTGYGSAFGTLNKNSKPKPKQTVVANQADAFNFFAGTGNYRLLKEKTGLTGAAISEFFNIFYESKIDLGDLDNKTLAEVARNFYYWLPKHLAAGQNVKEKSCAKKESYAPQAKQDTVRGVAAAMKFAEVKMREE